MNHARALIVLTLAAGGIVTQVRAREGQWNEFQVGILGVRQADGFHDPLSLDVHWTPSLSEGSFSIRGDLGFSVLNATSPGTSAKSKFATFSYQAFAEFVLVHNLVAGVGGGFQSWLDRESLRPILGAQAVLLVVEVPLISRISIGLSRFFASRPAWQWNFGVGLRFE